MADLAGGARTQSVGRLEREEVEERCRGCGVEGAGLAVGKAGGIVESGNKRRLSVVLIPACIEVY
jgi:hypothetical protein